MSFDICCKYDKINNENVFMKYWFKFWGGIGNMTNKIWYLGLDIGTASVGGAATDTEYKIIRKNKKIMGS